MPGKRGHIARKWKCSYIGANVPEKPLGVLQMQRPSLGTLCFQSSDKGSCSWKPEDEMGLPVVMSCRRNKLLNTSLYG